MGLDPTNPDSDSDTLKDGAEIVGAGARGATYPTDADSDDDALTDGQESSSGIDGTKTHTHAISGGGAAAINNGDWVPSLGGVTGPGLLDLFGGFTYSGTGADSGASQTFTLSGLTPGQGYLLRLYVRLRDTEGSGRATDLSFTNGTQTDYVPLLEDRPAIMLGDPADAFYHLRLVP